MQSDGMKETRRLLRHLQTHLHLSHTDLGARCETLGLVNVIFHPGNATPDLNYVTPRQRTAWITGTHVQQGLDRLLALERTPCVQVIEGLYPPLFAKTLRDLGLEAQQETPLLLYQAEEVPSSVPATEDVQIAQVHDQYGAELWWTLWRNGLYDVLTTGIEPLIRWRSADVRHGQQIDVRISREKSLAGVARVSLQPQNHSAHIVALALLQEARSPGLTRSLMVSILQQALAHQCPLVFAPGESDEIRKLCRELGFVDVGSLISYTRRSDPPGERNEHGFVEQPVLTTQ